MKYEYENCLELANIIVDSLDLDDCLSILVEVLAEQMSNDRNMFDVNLEMYLDYNPYLPKELQFNSDNNSIS